MHGPGTWAWAACAHPLTQRRVAAWRGSCAASAWWRDIRAPGPYACTCVHARLHAWQLNMRLCIHTRPYRTAWRAHAPMHGWMDGRIASRHVTSRLTTCSLRRTAASCAGLGWAGLPDLPTHRTAHSTLLRSHIKPLHVQWVCTPGSVIPSLRLAWSPHPCMDAWMPYAGWPCSAAAVASFTNAVFIHDVACMPPGASTDKVLTTSSG